MKKYLKYIPHIIFASLIIGMGAFGKLTGNPMSISLFEKLGLFGQPEYIGRYLVGIAELFAGIGIFCISTRKIAAILGIGLMIGALFFHITMLGLASAVPALVILITAIWILKVEMNK